MIDKFIFPIIRTNPVPDPYKGERSVYEPGICMRLYCGEARWKHPEKGDLVLCQDHAEEVFRKEAKAPPLRPFPDYVSTARKTFLVDHLPSSLVTDNHEEP